MMIATNSFKVPLEFFYYCFYWKGVLLSKIEIIVFFWKVQLGIEF